MYFDLIFVAYNSEMWIENCFKSIYECDYERKKINIYVLDNNSTDGTKEKLKSIQNSYIGESFASFNIIESDKNLGFGVGNNKAFEAGNSDIAVFLNIDTEVMADTFIALKKEIENAEDDIAAWEMRQYPYEHPKFYNILSGETSWMSGAAFAVRRTCFSDIGGFDEKIFMYAEDVDLSWRLRASGKKIKYCPKVGIFHYSYKEANEVKPNQYLNSIVNNLLLRYRFGGIKDWLWWHASFFSLMSHKGPFEHSRKMLIKTYFKNICKIPHFFKYRFSSHKKNIAKFIGWDYELIREGAFYYNERSKLNPKISILVRTCQRPSVLRETLISLRNQTYDNFEIVLVEDGEAFSKKMIEEEFSDLNINYYATNKRGGRSQAGNIAMGRATGDYFNFLDDDDLFYADHIETLVRSIERCDEDVSAIYSYAFETPIEIYSREPYSYREVYHNSIYRQKFNKLMLCHHNYIPIQSIMFRRELYEKYGGFDTRFDALEDWDLWLRYSLENDFKEVEKTTSVYRVPYNSTISQERQDFLDSALDFVREKHKNYMVTISASEINEQLQSVIDSYYFKVSNEVIGKMQKRMPLIIKLGDRIKNIIKRKFF